MSYYLVRSVKFALQEILRVMWCSQMQERLQVVFLQGVQAAVESGTGINGQDHTMENWKLMLSWSLSSAPTSPTNYR